MVLVAFGEENIAVWGIFHSCHILFLSLLFFFFVQNIFENSFPIGSTEKNILF